MTEQVFRLVASLLVGVWVARFLGPEQFGVYTYAMVVVTVLASIAKLGLDELVVRHLVHAPQLSTQILSTAFWLKMAGSAFTLMGLIVWVGLERSTHSAYILIIAMGILFQAFDVIDFYFQSQLLSKYAATCRMAQLLLSALLKVGLVLMKAELVWFVWVLLFDQFFVASTLYWIFRRTKNHLIFRSFQSPLAKELLQESWPLLINALVVILYMRIDQLLIAWVLGPKDMGVYAAASRISEMAYVIPVVVVGSVFPALIRLRQTDPIAYARRLKQIYAGLFWLAAAIAFPLTLWSSNLIDLLYGQAYQGAAAVMAVHIWTCVFVFIGVPFSKHLVIHQKTPKLMVRTFCGVLINVIALLLLLPGYGIYGAAWAALIAQAYVNFLGDVLDPQTWDQLHLKTQAFLKPFAANRAE